MEKNEQQMPRLGEPVPAFEAMTTKGKISFPDDYKGKWVILFSHPADFTPICTTEILTFGARYRAGCSGRLLKMALIRSMSNLAERS